MARLSRSRKVWILLLEVSGGGTNRHGNCRGELLISIGRREAFCKKTVYDNQITCRYRASYGYAELNQTFLSCYEILGLTNDCAFYMFRLKVTTFVDLDMFVCTYCTVHRYSTYILDT